MCCNFWLICLCVISVYDEIHSHHEVVSASHGDKTRLWLFPSFSVCFKWQKTWKDQKKTAREKSESLPWLFAWVTLHLSHTFNLQSRLTWRSTWSFHHLSDSQRRNSHTPPCWHFLIFGQELLHMFKDSLGFWFHDVVKTLYSSGSKCFQCLLWALHQQCYVSCVKIDQWVTLPSELYLF